MACLSWSVSKWWNLLEFEGNFLLDSVLSVWLGTSGQTKHRREQNPHTQKNEGNLDMKPIDELAVNGGEKVSNEPFPPWPWFAEDTIQAAMEPLKTGEVNYWTGHLGIKFEEAFAEWCGAKYGISTTNGTSALHTALVGLGIGVGDEVITPSYTFIASSFCIVQAGAIPVFADVEPKKHTISAEDIERKISSKTKAIVCVHLYGEVCDMDGIVAVAKKHNLKVIEDCAQAHGATYKGKKVGTIGHMGAFSFCQSKTFTTGGEGGCIITDDEDAMWLCRSFRDHGYDVERRLNMLQMEQLLPYIHNMVGFNYRMTEIQSAIGLKELAKIDTWNLANRRRNGMMLLEMLRDVPHIVTLPTHTPESQNGFWQFPVVIDIDSLTVDIHKVREAIQSEGIPCGRVFWPQCYHERAYKEHKGLGGKAFPFDYPGVRPEAVDYANTVCPNAAWVEERCFFVPVHPTYELKHMELTGKAIKKVLAAYSKV